MVPSTSTIAPKPIRRRKSSTRNKEPVSEACLACVPGSALGSSNVLVQCEACLAWLHWICAALNPLDEIETIENFFCKLCIAKSASTSRPLTTTFKSPIRRSNRDVAKIDYNNLSMGLNADVEKWIRVLATRQVKEGAFKEYKAEDINLEWLFGTEESMTEPFWIATPAGLDMKMPLNTMSISEIAAVVGPQTPIEVIDVASQSSLSHWTLQQWADYYEDPKRDKVRNVISLEVSQSPLSQQVEAPALVRQLDWVGQFWPHHLKKPGMYPQVMKYCLMSVARCWTDWHVDFAGSSVFYHVLRGSKVFYFIRPSAANLVEYEKWSGDADRQENTWLGDVVDVVYKIELSAGMTMIIPTGWIHAVYTPQDSLVIGGNFLHSLNIATQLRIYEIELATKVPKKFRYPNFVKLLWFVCNNYTQRLRNLKITPGSTASLPYDINVRVLEGLRALSTFLIEQTTRMSKNAPVSAERRRIARENVPWEEIPDPGALAREFRTLLLTALGEVIDSKCATPELEEPLDISSPPLLTTSTSTKKSTKRRAVVELSEGKKKLNFKNWSDSTPPAQQGTTREGEVLSQKLVTEATLSTIELRQDPKLLELGTRLAQVKSTTVNNSVVRRVEQEEGIMIETRTVVTTIERVLFLKSDSAVNSSML